jgi:hypothetical protein
VTQHPQASSSDGASTRRRPLGTFATLRTLLHAKGTPAPAGFRAPSRRAGRVPALLCGVLAALALTALTVAPAQAAEPTLTIDPVSAHTITTAHVSGEVQVPAANNATYWCFEYTPEGTGSWNGFCYSGPVQPGESLPVEADLSGLSANQPYEVRLAAIDFAEFNEGSEAFSPVQTFTTDPAPQAPVVALEPPTPSYISAQIQGSVDPEGGNLNSPANPVPIHWAIELSETGEPETFFAVAEGDISEGPAEESNPITVPESPAEPGLTQNTTYHYRLRASYAGQQVLTSDATFTTKEVQKPQLTIADASLLTATTAHASGTVELAQNDPAFNSSCVFEYATAEDFSGASQIACEPETILASEAQPVAVKADLTALIPGTTYHLRLTATNAGGTEQASAPGTFTTEALPPAIDASFATAVGETEATLGAKVNPGGAPTTFHFEYLTEAQFKADGNSFGAGTTKAPEPDEVVGSDDEDHTVEATITGLQPGTAYRYRVIATNEKSPSGLPGPTRGFTTTSPSTDLTGTCPANEALRRENNSTALPDCRAYELVSPVDKGGFAAYSGRGLPVQTSPSGEKIAYLSGQSFPGAGAQGSTALYSAHVSGRTPSGWQTSDWTPPTPTAEVPRIFKVGYDFSEDLTQAVAKVPLVPVTPEATPRVYNLFLRHPDGAYSWVNAAAPALSAEQLCPEPEELATCWQFHDVSTFAGGSADFSHVLFESNAQLKPEAPETSIESLYESSGGQVSLVGFLPDRQPASTSTAGAGSSVNYPVVPDRRVEHAISTDGSRVVFQAPSDEGEANEAGQGGLIEVYDRIEGNQTIELSAPAPGATPANPAPGPATFWAASTDGSRVFFTSPAELTTASNTGPAGEHEDLYEFDFTKPLNQRLTDLSVAADPAGARVLGVIDAADDGSYVYFVAEGQLDGAKGTDGQPNLYMVHDAGEPNFIATLNSAGACNLGGAESADACDWTPFPLRLEAYVTPDGKHLALMSTESLATANFPSGYDNTDQKTGEADSEVYEWSAETGELLCGSCDPSGERPLGNALIGGITPGTSLIQGKPILSAISTPFDRVRSLSDNGARLFYAAPASQASPADKVYEYEHDGEGSCTSSAGCHYLISSSGGEETEQFLGAGPDGRDVFFLSPNRIVPSDEDNLKDIYDARAESGFAVPSPPPICEGEGCPGSASTPPVTSARGTTTFVGPEEDASHLLCDKRQVKRHGVCVRKRHQKKAHHKRAKRNHGGSR